MDCAGTYIDGQFIWEKIPNGISKTWSYSDHLLGRDIDYAHLLVAGKSLSDTCPSHLTERWGEANKLLKSHYTAIHTSKIDIEDVCFYDLVPRKHLQHYFDVKNEITKWVFENVEKPPHYNLLKRMQAAVKELKSHPVNLNSFAVYVSGAEDMKAKHLYDQFGDSTPYVDYDIFGTVTGRLTTKKSSFPILNLKKELKNHVRPNNDVFLELDFNAAEVRTMLALQNHKQPEEDIHECKTTNNQRRISMSGISKTFLRKNSVEKKLKQNYLLGSTTTNPKQYNQISTIGKVLEKDIMTERRFKPLSGEQLLLPHAKLSTTYYNQVPRITQWTAFAKFLTSLGQQDPMLLSLFMIALSSTYTKMIGE
jgi:hypothetical protein